MKITALIGTGRCEIVVTKTSCSYIPGIGDEFSGRYQDEDGNVVNASGTVIKILSVDEDWA